MRRQIVAIACVMMLLGFSVACSSSCSSKPATSVTTQSTPLEKAASAAADIADALPAFTTTVNDLEVQKLISPQVALTLLRYRDAASAANRVFIAGIHDVEAGAKPLSALAGNFQAISDAVNKIAGVSVSDPKARQSITLVLSGIRSALAIIQAVVVQ